MPVLKNIFSTEEFGRRLLLTNDLDPVYVVLYHANLPRLKEWLLAYWCFYHVGTASWITDHENYWEAMNEAAASKEYPRSSERRHFRGKFAVKAVERLKVVGIPKLFFGLYKCKTAEEVMDYVKTWYGFGDWISFKIADMIERLGLVKIVFDVETIKLFQSPLEGAREYLRRNSIEVVYGEEVKEAVNSLIEILQGHKAPPSNDRDLGVQEIETILCKWKSYIGGHYEVGEDVKALRNGLLKFSSCTSARKLLCAGIKGGLWQT